MAWDDIPRTRSFSLGDFHDFDRCCFRFFVNHHLQKKYELAEGNPAQTIGTLLDLAIKKLHATKSYGQPIDYLKNLIKAAENEIREDIEKRGKNSFYGSQLEFLTPEIIDRAKEIFAQYNQQLDGKYQKIVTTQTMLKSKPFWKKEIKGAEDMQIWGGPDSIETGSDGEPEVVDYKYFEDSEKGQSSLDMDLMPKLYMLLCAGDLIDLGFEKARFKVRLWNDAKNESFYEEFDLNDVPNLENFFKDKMERILRTKNLSFCDKSYCKACNSPQRDEWVAELKVKGWVEESGEAQIESLTVAPDLPF